MVRKHRFVAAVLAGGLAACSGNPPPPPKPAGNDTIKPTYSERSGRLERLDFDSDGNRRTDTVARMDGARIIRIEIDRNEDGKTDRWEYYDASNTLVKVGTSRPDDGIEDAWSYPGPDGRLARVEVSTRRDGRPNRVEFYQDGSRTRAEEDTDGDGRVDKWEAWDRGRLASVEFDRGGKGTPTHRYVYPADGSALRLETLGK